MNNKVKTLLVVLGVFGVAYFAGKFYFKKSYKEEPLTDSDRNMLRQIRIR